MCGLGGPIGVAPISNGPRCFHPSDPDPPPVTLRTFEDFVAHVQRGDPSFAEVMAPALYDAVLSFMMEQGGQPFVMMCSQCRCVAKLEIPRKFWKKPSEILIYVTDADGSRPLSLIDLVLAPWCGTIDVSGGQGDGLSVAIAPSP